MFCDNDGSFGPGADCRTLDFTLSFEASILFIVPDVLFLFCALPRITQLLARPILLARLLGARLVVKACVALLVIASSAAYLAVVSAKLHHDIPSMYTGALALSLISSLVLAPLAYEEHQKNPGPSSLLIGYTFCKAIFTAANLRTLHMSHSPSGTVAAASITTAAYCLFLFAEVIEKRSLLKPEIKENYTGEGSESFLSRSAFFWLFPIMWNGRKTRLTLATLGDVPVDNRAKEARAPLVIALDAIPKSSSTRLLSATMHAYTSGVLLPILPRLILLAATFCQPFLVQRIVSYVQDPTESMETGWYLVAGFVCVFGMITLSTAVFWEAVYAITVRYRAALVGVVYGKALRLASHASRTVGVGGASTYMAVDVERISEGLEYIHEFWAAVISIPIAIAIMYDQAKWAAFAPLAVIAAILLTTGILGGPIGKRQEIWLAATDKRIKLLSSVFANILPIKMSGYEHHLGERITELRHKEMREATLFYNVIAWTAALSNAASIFCGLAVLGTYAAIASSGAKGYDLTVTRIFTILTTVNLLNGPLNMIGQGLPSILAAYASMKRIQTFLAMDEKRDITADDLNERLAEKAENMGLSIENASFSWLPDSPVVLEDIDVTLQPGKLHMVVGPVAAGKTSLLVSMLGESTLVKGEINCPKGRMAYASQDAFIVVGTCRENITFGRPFDQAHYDAVVQACALTADFDRLPFRDQTQLGDKGVSLSGGQRQRLALARAVYANAPILLLDDVLSALDGETEKHVFESLFGPAGLVRHSTVVLATHNVHYLSLSDWVIALDKGRVAHQGTYDDVSKSGYDLTGTLARSTGPTDSNEKGAAKKDGEKTKESETSTDKDDTEDDETMGAYDKGRSAYYKFYAEQIGYFRVSILSCFLLLYSAIRLGTQGFIKEWSESDGSRLGAWMGGYVAFSFIGAITGLSLFMYFNHTLTSGGENVHRTQVNAVFAAPIAFFQSIPTGRLVNRFSSDIFQLDFVWPLSMLNAASTFTTILGTLVLIYIATPWLAISGPVMLLAYWLLIKFYLGTSKQIQNLEAASKSPLYTSFSNTLGGLETVRAFQAQNYFRNQTDEAINRSQGPFYYRFGGMRFLRTFLSLFTMIVAIGIAALAVGLRHTTSAGFLGVALSSVTSLTTLLSNFMMSYSQLENGVVSIKRIHELATLEPEKDPGAETMTVPTKKDLWPQHGSIVFNEVSLKYRENLEPALKGISFSVKGGQKIGICGRTGSGKSSTVMALFRAMDQSLMGGRILLDGVDIATVPLSLLRDSLSLVSQEPFLWHAPLRELLDVDLAHNDDKLWDALERVGLKEAVAAMPDKLDTVIEDGGSLSRGQKQLMCLARVLLRGSRVVVLDEATSSMDIVTDAKIKQVVETDLADRTVVAVAHRISSIIHYDLILVLDNGLVAEFGSPQDLLRDPSSRFSRLAAVQGLHSPDNNVSDPAAGEIVEEF